MCVWSEKKKRARWHIHNIKREYIKIKAKQKREINLGEKRHRKKKKPAPHINMENSMVTQKKHTAATAAAAEAAVTAAMAEINSKRALIPQKLSIFNDN